MKYTCLLFFSDIIIPYQYSCSLLTKLASKSCEQFLKFVEKKKFYRRDQYRSWVNSFDTIHKFSNMQVKVAVIKTSSCFTEKGRKGKRGCWQDLTERCIFRQNKYANRSIVGIIENSLGAQLYSLLLKISFLFADSDCMAEKHSPKLHL